VRERGTLTPTGARAHPEVRVEAGAPSRRRRVAVEPERSQRRGRLGSLPHVLSRRRALVPLQRRRRRRSAGDQRRGRLGALRVACTSDEGARGVHRLPVRTATDGAVLAASWPA